MARPIARTLRFPSGSRRRHVVVEDRLNTVPADQQGLKDAFRESGTQDGVLDPQRRLGHVGRVLKQATLPTMKVGVANRITCQRGKFQGITASTGPMGWYLR